MTRTRHVRRVSVEEARATLCDDGLVHCGIRDDQGHLLALCGLTLVALPYRRDDESEDDDCRTCFDVVTEGCRTTTRSVDPDLINRLGVVNLTPPVVHEWIATGDPIEAERVWALAAEYAATMLTDLGVRADLPPKTLERLLIVATIVQISFAFEAAGGDLTDPEPP